MNRTPRMRQSRASNQYVSGGLHAWITLNLRRLQTESDSRAVRESESASDQRRQQKGLH